MLLFTVQANFSDSFALVAEILDARQAERLVGVAVALGFVVRANGQKQFAARRFHDGLADMVAPLTVAKRLVADDAVAALVVVVKRNDGRALGDDLLDLVFESLGVVHEKDSNGRGADVETFFCFSQSFFPVPRSQGREKTREVKSFFRIKNRGTSAFAVDRVGIATGLHRRAGPFCKQKTFRWCLTGHNIPRSRRRLSLRTIPPKKFYCRTEIPRR